MQALFKSFLAFFSLPFQELIFEYDLPYTDTIQNIVNEKNHNLEIKAITKYWFEKRELMKSLNQQLEYIKNKKKVKKI